MHVFKGLGEKWVELTSDLRGRFGRKGAGEGPEAGHSEESGATEGLDLDTSAMPEGTAVEGASTGETVGEEIPAFLRPGGAEGAEEVVVDPTSERVTEVPAAEVPVTEAETTVTAEGETPVTTETATEIPKKSFIRRFAIPAVALLAIAGSTTAWLLNRNRAQGNANASPPPVTKPVTPNTPQQPQNVAPKVNLVPTTMEPGTIFFEGTDPSNANRIIFVDNAGVCTIHEKTGAKQRGNYYPDKGDVVFQVSPSNAIRCTLGNYDPKQNYMTMSSVESSGQSVFTALQPSLVTTVTPGVYAQPDINGAGIKLQITADNKFILQTGLPNENFQGTVLVVGNCTILECKEGTFYLLGNIIDEPDLVNPGILANRSSAVKLYKPADQTGLSDGFEDLKSMLSKSEWTCNDMGIQFKFSSDGTVTASNPYDGFKAEGKWGKSDTPGAVNLGFEGALADYLDGKTVLAGQVFTIQLQGGGLRIWRTEIPGETRTLESK